MPDGVIHIQNMLEGDDTPIRKLARVVAPEVLVKAFMQTSPLLSLMSTGGGCPSPERRSADLSVSRSQLSSFQDLDSRRLCFATPFHKTDTDWSAKKTHTEFIKSPSIAGRHIVPEVWNRQHLEPIPLTQGQRNKASRAQKQCKT
jgi:hypothetical protein